ncbi:MAG TPA: GMC family oxidoreductase [Candidatus Limnocylindrales bacterium]|nr:GMC family oxidoreductase [Candidatus Limnocylindrales bacterium]
MSAGRDFDVVVIGAGAGGCVMAGRLARAGVGSILLLEAGPDLRADLPSDLLDAWRLPRPPDWGYASEPTDGGELQKLRRGRLVGGTSWFTRFAVRGSRADFDRWAALGNPGWAFDDVLPYFRRFEADEDFGDRPWHGNLGYLPINRYLDVELTEAHAAAVAAAEAIGFSPVDDHNQPGALGVGRMPMNSVIGVRVSATAYLDVPELAGSLDVRADSPVDRVVIEGGRATGVRLVDGSVIEAATIVVAGGTYGSPLVLMRSGIGPAGDLRALGIDVQVDLPGVGANLSDHPSVVVDTGYHGPARDIPKLHSIATFHSNASPPTEPHDLLLWIADPEAPDVPDQLAIESVLLRPEARGRVSLRSADPNETPRIELPKATDRDIRRLREGIERAIAIASHSAMRGLCPGPATTMPEDDDALRTYIAENGYSIPHVVGTCAMGPRPEDGAVVDASGRVHGIDGLFVADASIIPEPPSGFSHLPTLMLAERLSEVVAGAANRTA